MGLRTLCSEDEEAFFCLDAPAVALDLETMDDFDRGIEDAPVVSCALTVFDPDSLEDALPTLVRLIDDLQEEDALLERLFDDLERLDGPMVAGHNVGFPQDFEYLDAEGYDLPKLEARAEVYGMETRFLHDLETYDTMDVAGEFYRHEEHHKSHEWLRLGELVDWLGIEPPSKFVDLGSDIRRLWRRGDHDRIMLYNAAGSMMEARLAAVFEHQLTVCTVEGGRISSRQCRHTEGLVPLREIPAWERLKGQTRFAGGDV